MRLSLFFSYSTLWHTIILTFLILSFLTHPFSSFHFNSSSCTLFPNLPSRYLMLVLLFLFLLLLQVISMLYFSISKVYNNILLLCALLEHITIYHYHFTVCIVYVWYMKNIDRFIFLVTDSLYYFEILLCTQFI